jgi:hypothetical protein
MGCCNSVGRMPAESLILDKLKTGIEAGSAEKIRVAMRMMAKAEGGEKFTFIDLPLVTFKNIKLSLLGYAAWVGKTRAFKCLYEEFQASVVEMEKLMLESHFSALDIMCERGFNELLLYYMPIYLQFSHKILTRMSEKQLTLDLDQSPTGFTNVATPVHKACELGNISILLDVYNFFKEKEFKPYVLDLDFQDETTGENCALIACRCGNFPMLKFLHEVTKADFSAKNKNGENAIAVCLAAAKRAPSRLFFECLVYLVETVRVDLKEQYEECLLLAQDREVVNYLENKLKNEGISTGKQTLEAENRIKFAAKPKSDLSIQLDKQDEFYIKEFIGEPPSTTSVISAIPNLESHLEPFFSVLGNNNSILRS